MLCSAQSSIFVIGSRHSAAFAFKQCRSSRRKERLGSNSCALMHILLNHSARVSPTTCQRQAIQAALTRASSALGGCREESDAPETGPAPASENGSPAINIVNLFGSVNVGSGSQATINAGPGSQTAINVVNYFGQINAG